jgi:hypothetical protein
MLMGDHHRIRSVDRLGVGEHPWVDDHHLPLVLEPHTGMTELW